MKIEKGSVVWFARLVPAYRAGEKERSDELAVTRGVVTGGGKTLVVIAWEGDGRGVHDRPSRFYAEETFSETRAAALERVITILTGRLAYWRRQIANGEGLLAQARAEIEREAQPEIPFPSPSYTEPKP